MTNKTNTCIIIPEVYENEKWTVEQFRVAEKGNFCVCEEFIDINGFCFNCGLPEQRYVDLGIDKIRRLPSIYSMLNEETKLFITFPKLKCTATITEVP